MSTKFVINHWVSSAVYFHFLVYYLYIRSMLLYSAPVWSNTCETNYGKLQRIQNNCLRLIGSFPRRTPIDLMHSMHIPSISTYVYTITLKFVTKYDNSMYPHIAEILNYSLSTFNYKRLMHLVIIVYNLFSKFFFLMYIYR
jgi:hypothetical protein